MGQAALSNEKQSAPFFCVYPNALPKAAEPPHKAAAPLQLSPRGSPSPTLPKWRELIPAVFEAVGWFSFSSGARLGCGLSPKCYVWVNS